MLDRDVIANDNAALETGGVAPPSAIPIDEMAEAAPVFTDPAGATPPAEGDPAGPTGRLPLSLTPDAAQRVTLPAGISFDTIRVDGHDLLLVQADGTEIRILGAADHIPSFVLGTTEIPAATLVSVLQANGINIAAGPDGTVAVVNAPSSGGGLTDAPLSLGEAGPVIGLLGATELHFSAPDFAGLDQLTNRPPQFVDFTAAGALSEEGLSGGLADDRGTPDTTDASHIEGRFEASDPDGNALTYRFGLPEAGSGLTSGGREILWRLVEGQLEGYVRGEGNEETVILRGSISGTGYRFDLLGPIDHPVGDREDALGLSIPVTVSDGAVSTTAMMTLPIEDDAPLALSQDETAPLDEASESRVATGTLAFKPGADGLASLAVTGLTAPLKALHQNAVTGEMESYAVKTSWTASGKGGTFTGSIDTPDGKVTVFTLTLDDKGHYKLTLFAPLVHPDDGSRDDLDLDFTYRITDGDGDTASGHLLLTVHDDGPETSLSLANEVDENGTVDGTWSWHGGADGVGSVSITVNGVTQTIDVSDPDASVTFTVGHSTLVFYADGTCTLTSGGVDDDETIKIGISVTDGDGDTASVSRDVMVADVYTPMTQKTGLSGTVEEEHGLKGGRDDGDAATKGRDEDTAADLDRTTNIARGTLSVSGGEGKITFHLAEVEGDPVVHTVGPGSPALKSGGEDVHYAKVGNEIVGYVHHGNGTGYDPETDLKVFTLSVKPDGSYSFTLHAPVDHPAGGGENLLSIDLDGMIEVSDSEETIPIKGAIDVIDDVPDPANDQAEIGGDDVPGCNVAFVLDFSGSISDPDLARMISAVKDAAQKMFNGGGQVDIDLVAFGRDAVGVDHVTDYKALCDRLDAWVKSRPIDPDFTNYTAAIGKLLDVYTAVPGAFNHVFFLSDGDPNKDRSTKGPLEDALAARWKDFVGGNHVEVSSIGIGNVISKGPLMQIDVDGKIDVVMLKDYTTLSKVLCDLIQVPPLTGNVISGTTRGGADHFGADGGSITGVGAGDDSSGKVGSVIEGHYGKLVLKADGSYSYELDSSLDALKSLGRNETATDVFTYKVTDRDGDAATATLTITIHGTKDMPTVLADDHVVTNAKSTEIDIPSWAVLFNDDPDSVLTIGTLTMGKGGVSISGSTVLHAIDDDDDSAAPTFSFTYRVGTDTATVTVDRTGGADLSGGRGNDILIDARSGGHALSGGDGNDILIGNDGADRMTGGKGRDVFVIGEDSGTHGVHDTITDYHAAEGDLVDLTALLRNVSGQAGFKLSDYVRIERDGDDANLMVRHGSAFEFVAKLTSFDVANDHVKILFDEHKRVGDL